MLPYSNGTKILDGSMDIHRHNTETHTRNHWFLYDINIRKRMMVGSTNREHDPTIPVFSWICTHGIMLPVWYPGLLPTDLDQGGPLATATITKPCSWDDPDRDPQSTPLVPTKQVLLHTCLGYWNTDRTDMCMGYSPPGGGPYS